MDDWRFKHVPFAVKSVDSDGRTIEGYAAAFGNVDSWGDVIQPGAFAKTIKENAARIKVAWQHDFWEVIGIPVELREDDVGLYTRSHISRTQRGNEALELARDGAITEMSIGYVPVKYEENDSGGYDLYEVKLMEYSLVTWAANPLARITAIKAAVGGLTEDDRRRLLALLGTEPAPATQPPKAAAATGEEPAAGHSALPFVQLEAMGLRADGKTLLKDVRNA